MYRISKILPGLWIVTRIDPRPLRDKESENYYVTNHGGEWKCGCADHYFRKRRCKHIRRVQGAT